MERSRLAELDSLCNAAQKRVRAGIQKTLSVYLNDLSSTYAPLSLNLLEGAYTPNIDPDLVRETETLIATALLLGMDHASRKLDMSDTEIPPLPFEEAVSFMKSRIPMTKTEWNALEPKLRFRAFTVARLAQCDYIEATRGRIITAMQKGEGFASTWKDIKAISESDGALQLSPGYWENVFRTNTQTAYTAGKLMQFKNNPPPAWRLLIVEDSRTSNICRGLIREGNQSLTLASDHPFWKTFGYPPYHFQCRTGLQAVYESQIGTDIQTENPSMASLRKNFHPMKGFGGDPLDSGNYWMMTKGMFERGLRYGIINEFNMLDNIVSDFNSVWKGYKREIVGKGWIDVHESVLNSKEFKQNYEVAKKLAFTGEHIKILPEHKPKGVEGWKNPDYLINGSLFDLKSPKSHKYRAVFSLIREAQEQRASGVVIDLPSSTVYDDFLWRLRGQILNNNPIEIEQYIFLHKGSIEKYSKNSLVNEAKRRHDLFRKQQKNRAR